MIYIYIYIYRDTHRNRQTHTHTHTHTYDHSLSWLGIVTSVTSERVKLVLGLICLFVYFWITAGEKSQQQRKITIKYY